ncbi:Major Facilitator Superfamily [Nesidiocoris tenuis]|uniref:Major Facilitator Superfamily n=1 Tax=Nesidiocoris tenuis TaxID=355587 RepID=A0ABN7ART2_9HEMI|nr:Major Facilitator Superfamily [Nesidiocoris tenuis]
MGETSEKPSKCWASRPTVEPIVFAVFFVINTMASPTIDLVMRQGCRDYGLDPDGCSADENIDHKVHRISSNFTLFRTLMETLPGVFISLLTGPWATVKGRKPFLIASTLGYMTSQAAWAYLSTIDDIKPYYLLFGSLPACLTGGQILIIITCFCYMIDITTFQQRIMGLAVIMSIMSGTPIFANYVTPKLASYGYPFLYGTNTVIMLVTFLYAFFLLPESVKRQKDVEMKLFTFDHLLETFKTFVKRRPNNVRGVIISITALGCVSIFLLSGEPDVKYQSVIEEYHWNLEDFSNYNTIYSAIGFVGTILGIYVGENLLKIPELLLALGMMILFAIGAFLMGLAPAPASYAIVSQLQCFRGCISPIARGTVSKMIPHEEVSNVIAFMTSLEAFSPELGALIYTTIYNATLASYPFTVYFFSCAMAVLGIFLILLIFMLQGGIRVTKLPDDHLPQVEESVEHGAPGLEDITKF